MNEMLNLFYDAVPPETNGSISLKASELAALVELIGEFKVPVLVDTGQVLPPEDHHELPYIRIVVSMGGGAALVAGHEEELFEITLESGAGLLRYMQLLEHGRGRFGAPSERPF